MKTSKNHGKDNNWEETVKEAITDFNNNDPGVRYAHQKWEQNVSNCPELRKVSTEDIQKTFKYYWREYYLQIAKWR